MRAFTTKRGLVLVVRAETIEAESLCWACGAAGANDENGRNSARLRGLRALPVTLQRVGGARCPAHPRPGAGTGRRSPAAMEYLIVWRVRNSSFLGSVSGCLHSKSRTETALTATHLHDGVAQAYGKPSCPRVLARKSAIGLAFCYASYENGTVVVRPNSASGKRN